MKSALLAAGFLFVISGCASHYHKIKGDTLNLYLKEPHADRVILSCSLDGFEPHEARQENGRWIVSLPAALPFQYYYVLDEKIFIPSCRMKQTDDFGSENCIYDPDL